jgi:hypothetical protein
MVVSASICINLLNFPAHSYKLAEIDAKSVRHHLIL